MIKNYRRPFLKTVAAVMADLSAIWFGLAFIIPNFSPLINPDTIVILTKDITFGILFLLAATIIEKLL